ncbi:MAG: hypothetical protein M0P14_00210 [Alkaliphilus sp.]|nr:hypothetical protein [Alkaliphilus sp.]
MGLKPVKKSTIIMVMWMSRVERKKIENKLKRFFRICVFIQITLLICGLLAVDFQIRTTLGIDETGLISYRQTGDGNYIVHIMGDSHLVDISVIRSQLHNKFAQLKKMTYSIREKIWQVF